MKVILLNGSAHTNGTTFTALKIVQDRLNAQGIETSLFQVGSKPIIGCIGCNMCHTKGKCVFGDDGVNEVGKALEDADGLIVGSPVHYASASGAITSFMDRLFYSRQTSLRMKFGASIVACRRGGASSAFDQLNKYFTISQMPIVSSCYWNQIHGSDGTQALQDEEGVRTLQLLADNMAYLIKCQKKANLELPKEPEHKFTNFIR